jgi:hypothetical protein
MESKHVTLNTGFTGGSSSIKSSPNVCSQKSSEPNRSNRCTGNASSGGSRQQQSVSDHSVTSNATAKERLPQRSIHGVPTAGNNNSLEFLHLDGVGDEGLVSTSDSEAKVLVKALQSCIDEISSLKESMDDDFRVVDVSSIGKIQSDPGSGEINAVCPLGCAKKPDAVDRNQIATATQKTTNPMTKSPLDFGSIMACRLLESFVGLTGVSFLSSPSTSATSKY